MDGAMGCRVLGDVEEASFEEVSEESHVLYPLPACL